jgi:hypothetical protein
MNKRIKELEAEIELADLKITRLKEALLMLLEMGNDELHINGKTRREIIEEVLQGGLDDKGDN